MITKTKRLSKNNTQQESLQKLNLSKFNHMKKNYQIKGKYKR